VLFLVPLAKAAMKFWKNLFRDRSHPGPTASEAVTFDREEKRIDAGFAITYRYYKAPNKAAALAFLEKQNITAQSFFVAVKTPEGTFCRDRLGFYEP
jgi:hypothetical protein